MSVGGIRSASVDSFDWTHRPFEISVGPVPPALASHWPREHFRVLAILDSSKCSGPDDRVFCTRTLAVALNLSGGPGECHVAVIVGSLEPRKICLPITDCI